ncbi:flavin reductase family protein [Amycolatopsis jejuensis]|uniref:flavin reductase family protein n=1 Tax=Amycolatopsis jejuensis TaxID=330084 RepID=UPI000526A714|nr:flavin reductase family protein [Amycolatopsis jejuensis]
MSIDPRELRTCLGRFATGVTVITCAGEDTRHGATVNAFTAVSLDPPLVLVSLDRRTRISAYLPGMPFTVNVLHETQHDVALHFAGRPMDREPEWTPDGTALCGVVATLTCSPWRNYDGGDHVLFLGKVEELHHTTGEPLLFYGGAFRRLGPKEEAIPWLASGDHPELSWFSPTEDAQRSRT